MSQLTIPGVAAFDREAAQWHTPQHLARRVVEWAGVSPGMRVLEPGAGGGNIVRPLLEAGANVLAIEIDPAWCSCLFDEMPFSGGMFALEEGDFLVGPANHRFDLAVMNPPYNDGLDTEFLCRALEFTDRVVAILRTHALHGVERHDRFWRHVDLAGLALCVRRPKFGVGESAETAKHEFCVVDARRKGTWAGTTRIEWWE